MPFQLKRGDTLIDGFRVLEPVCEKQEYAIYRVEDGRYAVCFTEAVKEAWKEGTWVSDHFDSGQVHSLSCGFCYLTESGYKLYTPQHGPYPDDWESAEGFCRAFARFQKKYKEGQCPNVLYIEKYDWMLPLESEDDEKESPELLLGRWLTDGLPVNASSAEMVSRFCSWLSMEQIQQLIQCSGLPKEQMLENVDRKADCQELEGFREERFFTCLAEKNCLHSLNIRSLISFAIRKHIKGWESIHCRRFCFTDLLVAGKLLLFPSWQNFYACPALKSIPRQWQVPIFIRQGN